MIWTRRLRLSEWILVGFFGYVAGISPWFRNRPRLKSQPVLLFAMAGGTFGLLASLERGRLAIHVNRLRDWVPIAFTLVAFHEMELFLPRHFDHRIETQWSQWDHVLLAGWHVRSVIEGLGRVIPLYLEACYFLVYAVPLYGVLVLYGLTRRVGVDRFLSIYLAGTLSAYALFPFFPSEPPRLLFPTADMPNVATWIRDLNVALLRRATIHSSVFPSAHVSSAFSAAWAMFLLFPRRKALGWGLVCYAGSVSVATVYGRYHYAVDAVAGFGMSLIAAGLCFLFRRRQTHKKAGARERQPFQTTN